MDVRRAWSLRMDDETVCKRLYGMVEVVLALIWLKLGQQTISGFSIALMMRSQTPHPVSMVGAKIAVPMTGINSPLMAIQANDWPMTT